MDIMSKLTEDFGKLKADENIKAKALMNIKEWMESEMLTGYRPYIEHLIKKGEAGALLDAFWRMIPFGTGGRRGPVGAGPNRINPHTIALSVQGHCDYLRNVVNLTGEISVVVAYDVREFFDMRGVYDGVDGLLKNLTSRDMAKASAMTYAANGMTAYVVGPLEDENEAPMCRDRYISTPELSYLIRQTGSAGGLNISASHNHPDDNGGKFYNMDGGQEIPPNDELLLKEVEKVTSVKTMPYAEAREKGLIRIVSKELHDRYIEMNKALCPTSSRSAKIAFSPLSGTGFTTVGETLDALGFEVETVPEQSEPDGSFKAVRYRIANPEVVDSMDLLTKVAKSKQCDIGFSTDPDADRLGIMIPDGKGELTFINGNEIGVLLIESILQTKKRAGTLTKQPLFINTLVTSSLQREIAKRYGCQVIGDLMVGFKYMGDVLRNIEKSGKFPPAGEGFDRDAAQGTLDDFIFTCEESHGYLLTPHVRDKDACGAAVHLAGLASRLKDEERTMLGMLRDIYRVYGYTSNRLRSLVMEGIVGLERIARIQEVLRKNPPKTVAGLKVLNFIDNHVIGGPLKSSTDEASRNVLLFELENGENNPIRMVVRPSGTEPKTKIYVEVPSPSTIQGTLSEVSPEQLAGISDETLDGIIAETDARAVAISNEFMRFCLGKEVLGELYPRIPDESLLVSDLVPVDQKIHLVTDILPDLASKLKSGMSEADADKWLSAELKPFGEEPRGLIRVATRAWVDHRKASGDIDGALLPSLEALLKI